MGVDSALNNPIIAECTQYTPLW